MNARVLLALVAMVCLTAVGITLLLVNDDDPQPRDPVCFDARFADC